MPGDDEARRSFSMANLPGDGLIELMIKCYPGGRFSSLLGGEVCAGRELRFTGPYGAFHVRHTDRPVLMVAGGSGMAPILSVLRELAGEQTRRKVRFFYGARTDADLFHLEEIEALGAQLADFRFTPVVGGFVHESVGDYLAAGEMEDLEAYMCGPPPMIDAASRVAHRRARGRGDPHPPRQVHDLRRRGREERDDMTEPEPPISASRASAPRGTTLSARSSGSSPSAGARSLYEDVTFDSQPSLDRHVRPRWPMFFEDGRGMWGPTPRSCAPSDWYAFRDPGEIWERTYYQQGTAGEKLMEGAVAAARRERMLDDFTPEWVEFLRRNLQVPAFVEHGLWLALASAGRDCLSRHHHALRRCSTRR